MKYYQSIILRLKSVMTLVVVLVICCNGFAQSGSKRITVQGVTFTMVHIDGGTFMMGTKGRNVQIDERPPHKVTLDGFYVSQTEVSQALWNAIMQRNPSRFKGDTLPVERVSWNDAQVFIEELSHKTGFQFRLPTEAEWEYVARGGSWETPTHFSGTDTIDRVAWFSDNSEDHTHRVGSRRPNELGVYDMTGNVKEWCSDYYFHYYSESQVNPTGVAEGKERVVRGGAWDSDPWHCRITYRESYEPKHRDNRIGLRLVMIDNR